MKPVESVIILPSQVRFVSPALAFIRATAATCGFSDVALNEIEVAAEEALTNVIKHAFEGHSDETFKVSVRFTEADFLITIYEKGHALQSRQSCGVRSRKTRKYPGNQTAWAST